MRYFFFDRVVSVYPNRSMTALKCVSISEEFLPEHYGRRPIMPASLMIESMAQVAGWLNIISRNYTIDTVLALIEGVRVTRHAVPGDVLLIEVFSEYSHFDGFTARGQIRIGDEVIASSRRMVLANAESAEVEQVRERKERFAYLSDGFVIPEGPQ